MQTGEKVFYSALMRDKDRRRIQEHVHDPYRLNTKLPEPTVCTGCGAVYHEGRWQWAESRPAMANKDTCPACHRIQDNMPAGFLNLSGEFFRRHHNEIMRLIYHTVAEQKAQHPLKRIMGIEGADNGGVAITFTDMHLPHSVGEAIRHAYKGDLEIIFPKGTDVIRANWIRDE